MCWWGVSPLFCVVVVCVLVGCQSLVLCCSCMCVGGDVSPLFCVVVVCVLVGMLVHCFVL